MQTTATNGHPNNVRKSERVTCIRLVWRYAIILGTFSRMLRIFGYLSRQFPDFWVSFFWYNLISLEIIQISGY